MQNNLYGVTDIISDDRKLVDIMSDDRKLVDIKKDGRLIDMGQAEIYNDDDGEE